MSSNFNISALVQDLEPVKPLRPRVPLLVSALLTVVAVTVVIWSQGMRADLLAGKPDEMFLIRAGVLLLLGGATAHSVASMASPAVGRSQNGWQMALAAAVLFPLAAIIVATTGDVGPAFTAMDSGMRCMGYSLVGGLATAVPMIFWLRKGAPTSPERAGWLTGLASGGLGAFAYNIHCPFNNVVYIGLWYSLALIICAVLGRLIVPRLIRW
ncbi:NrsF family protein [Sphingorhabdus lacus]|uniref:DUF1109 domain-containing protein n=1 Tax=Sphingorhabdus lacus TaxID=392610 RepID=A0A6I6L1Z9_9SPHN|nr:DUF1109 domain-containing protein [Sphingorhabdus lacus]QGY79650.1 DUF1109 domain-containing protein [Sphingorhabdus lacus]